MEPYKEIMRHLMSAISEKLVELLLILGIVAVLLFYFFYYISNQQECDEAGGTLVLGIVQFNCVQALPLDGEK